MFGYIQEMKLKVLLPPLLAVFLVGFIGSIEKVEMIFDYIFNQPAKMYAFKIEWVSIGTTIKGTILCSIFFLQQTPTESFITFLCFVTAVLSLSLFSEIESAIHFSDSSYVFISLSKLAVIFVISHFFASLSFWINFVVGIVQLLNIVMFVSFSLLLYNFLFDSKFNVRNSCKPVFGFYMTFAALALLVFIFVY